MNIQPITALNFQNFQKTNKPYASTPKANNNLSSLPCDTVSFSGRSISDSIWNNFVKETPRFNRIATTFLNATESIARKLEDDGIYFIREMFEKEAVKNPDSKLSKVNRSKTFVVRDSIRTTLFSKNPYNVSDLFNKIIPEYADSGYHIAYIDTSVGEMMGRGYIPVEEERLINKFFGIEHTKESHYKYFMELKKLGYEYEDAKKLLAKYIKEGKEPNKEEFIEIVKSLKKSIPDIDIRLDKNRINMDGLPEEYKYFIGKPQKSGYEDIQLRFIRDVDKDNPKPVYHELLIQFGPTYNRNARKEHDMVYDHLRLFKELHIPLHEPVMGEVTFKEHPEKGVEKFISDVEDMFRTKVSKTLINNGKNADFFGNIEDNDEIFFTQLDISKFERKFSNIIGFMREYYKQLSQKAQMSSIASEQIGRDQRDDLRLINKIKTLLSETIDALNDEHDLSIS